MLVGTKYHSREPATFCCMPPSKQVVCRNVWLDAASLCGPQQAPGPDAAPPESGRSGGLGWQRWAERTRLRREEPAQAGVSSPPPTAHAAACGLFLQTRQVLFLALRSIAAVDLECCRAQAGAPGRFKEILEALKAADESRHLLESGAPRRENGLDELRV